MCLIVGACISIQYFLLSSDRDSIPNRKQLSDFPLQIDTWHGSTSFFTTDQLNALKLSDYFVADYYTDTYVTPVNFYIAYYATQRRDAAPHSPLICMPGSGWEIARLQPDFIVRDNNNQPVLAVNRALIKNGETTELVYFWFRERGRDLTTSPARKWFLFKDALAKGRTDGALVRIVLPVTTSTPEKNADETLTAFTIKIYPLLKDYIPD